jgi:pimeloyl-ACP methyl ester carboxylesterase
MADTDAYQRAVLTATSFRLKDDLDQMFRQFDPDKETVILLPGGSGSNLWRADKKFDQITNPANYNFDRVWLDGGIALGDGKMIEIGPDGHDVGNRVIVGDGDVRFRVKPYVKAMAFFHGAANVNAVLLGWDWRRNLLTAAEMLHSAIQTIKRKVGGRDPRQMMKNIFVVGHSMGGMVAKLFFQTHQDVARELGGMISVGTPFYGYMGQLCRIYEGDPDLNRLPPYNAKIVARITSSCPGLYTLFPIDKKTFDAVGDRLGLSSYPVTDLNGAPADAYDPHGLVSRFPQWVRRDQFEEARRIRQDLLAAPLPAPLDQALFHIRSRMPNSTQSTATWKQDLPGNYDPDRDPSPIAVGPKSDGDDTIPYWSAALVSTPAGNIIDFPDGHHMDLMAQSFILRRVLGIVSRGTRSISQAEFIAQYGPDPQMATREELTTFLSQIDWAAPGAVAQFEMMPEPLAWRFLQEIAM